MMKNLTLVLGLMIIASPAFASSARLNALGENGATGSYYVQDVRNIFLNPAQIVHFKKHFVLEFSPTDSATAQGLFTNTFGDYTYGISLNNNSVRANTLVGFANTALAASNNQFLGPDRTIEAFLAGEATDMNWGLSLFYSGNGDRNNTSAYTVNGTSYNLSGATRTSHLFGVRAGVDMNNFAVFTTVGITSNTAIQDANNLEMKGKVSVDVGATYTMDNTVAFAKFTTYGDDAVNVLGAGTTTEIRHQDYALGLGHKYEASKSVTLFSRLEADYAKDTRSNTSDAKSWNVPVAVGAEAQALSWLALRGSVVQSLVGQNEAVSAGGLLVRTNGSTSLNAGAGLTFGDVQVDGTLSAAVASTSTGFGIGSPLANVAFSYNF